jgi:hypothetical protein
MLDGEAGYDSIKLALIRRGHKILAITCPFPRDCIPLVKELRSARVMNNITNFSI